MAIVHAETKPKDLPCPYCNKPCKHLGNLKQHIFAKQCTHPRNEISPETWKDIVQKNPLKHTPEA